VSWRGTGSGCSLLEPEALPASGRVLTTLAFFIKKTRQGVPSEIFLRSFCALSRHWGIFSGQP
jgi:hypothetical protein